MKIYHNRSSQGGFTSAEMVVSAMVMAILGIVFLNVLNSGMILYAKNTAVNSAHQEARDGLNRLTRDIHASVSVPQLRNATTDTNHTTAGSFSVVSSTPVNGAAPTAAGVSFQDVLPGSPDYVWQDPGNVNLILIKDPGDVPQAGMRLIVPFWGVEDDITKVAAAGVSGHSNIFLSSGADVTIAGKARKYGSSFATSPYAITYYTERMLYVVEGGSYIADAKGSFNLVSGQYVAVTAGTGQYRYEAGQLNLYKQRNSSPGNNGYFYWSKVATVARNISSPQPFYVPLNSGGTADTKYVGVSLSTRDSKTSNRGYISSASFIDTKIDYRSRICLYQ